MLVVRQWEELKTTILILLRNINNIYLEVELLIAHNHSFSPGLVLVPDLLISADKAAIPEKTQRRQIEPQPQLF